MQARLEALAPDRLIGVIREKVATYAGRLAERAPAMESDIRDLDRVVKLLQIRGYLMLEELKLPDFVGKMLTRMESEHESTYDRDALEQELAQAVAWRDRAYAERNTLACVVARCIIEHGGRAGTWRDDAGEAGFQVVVGFDLPQGQVTFHMDERDPRRPWETLPEYRANEDGSRWDGHTDAEKWSRVRDFLDTAIGELGVFAADQICAAGFPLNDRTHARADIPCAHFPERDEDATHAPHIERELEESRKVLGLVGPEDDAETERIAAKFRDAPATPATPEGGGKRGKKDKSK